METITIQKRTIQGDRVADVVIPADDDVRAQGELAKNFNDAIEVADASKLVAIDLEGSPADAVPDVRVENLLNEIVSDNLTKIDQMYAVYRRCGFLLAGQRTLDMNAFRVLMHNPRVRERLKFLRESEFELNSPNRLSLTTRLETIMDDDEAAPKDRIAAINTISRIIGLDKAPDAGKGGTLIVQFNSCEKPLAMIQSS